MKFRLFISSVQKEFARKHSQNELIAAPMYLKGYIERLGTGTEDVAKLCAQSGLPAPGFAEGVDFRAVLKRSKITNGRDGAATEVTTESKVARQGVLSELGWFGIYFRLVAFRRHFRTRRLQKAVLKTSFEVRTHRNDTVKFAQIAHAEVPPYCKRARIAHTSDERSGSVTPANSSGWASLARLNYAL